MCWITISCSILHKTWLLVASCILYIPCTWNIFWVYKVVSSIITNQWTLNVNVSSKNWILLGNPKGTNNIPLGTLTNSKWLVYNSTYSSVDEPTTETQENSENVSHFKWMNKWKSSEWMNINQSIRIDLPVK